MYTKLAKLIGANDDATAVVRTLAPLAWGGAISAAGAYGVDLHVEIAALDGDGGLLTITSVASAGPLVLASALYLIAKFKKGLFEKIVLLIPGDPDYHADEVVPKGAHASGVVIDEDAPLQADVDLEDPPQDWWNDQLEGLELDPDDFAPLPAEASWTEDLD